MGLLPRVGDGTRREPVQPLGPDEDIRTADALTLAAYLRPTDLEQRANSIQLSQVLRSPTGQNGQIATAQPARPQPAVLGSSVSRSLMLRSWSTTPMSRGRYAGIEQPFVT